MSLIRPGVSLRIVHRAGAVSDLLISTRTGHLLCINRNPINFLFIVSGYRRGFWLIINQSYISFMFMGEVSCIKFFFIRHFEVCRISVIYNHSVPLCLEGSIESL